MKSAIAFVILAGISNYFTEAMGEDHNGMVLMIGVDKDILEGSYNYVRNNIVSPILFRDIPNMQEAIELFSDEQKMGEFKMWTLDIAERLLQELGEKVKMLRAGDQDPEYRRFISWLRMTLKEFSMFFDLEVADNFRKIMRTLDDLLSKTN